MGKPKTQRTDDLRQAARRYTVAKQAEQAIEQHNLDRLVRNGVLVRDEAEQSMLNSKAGGEGEGGASKCL